MPLILRKIRRSKWYKHEGVAWLQAGELQADILVDLKTEDNWMSVWLVEDDKSNLDDLLSALAATCAVLSNLDYATLAEDIVSAVGVKIVQTEGDTPNKDVNKWHHDLVELSVSKVVGLAKAILTSGETKRVQPRQILRLIARAVESGKIDATKLSEDIRAKLEKLN